MDLLIEVVTVTQWAQNCSILHPPGGGPAVLIDPGGETDRVMATAERVGADIQAILITHGHIDHIGGLNEAIAATGAPTYFHPDDQWLFEKGMWGGGDRRPGGLAPPVRRSAARGRRDPFQGPAHAGTLPRPRLLLGRGVGDPLLIGGDLIFMGSIGRTDLPRADFRQLITSVREKIWVLPDETTILPGHGQATTIGFEKKVNPFVSLDALEDLAG